MQHNTGAISVRLFFVLVLLRRLRHCKSVRRISYAGHLQKFAAELLADRALGQRIDTFEINMPFEDVALDFALIKRCLQVMPHLTDLTLELPFRLPVQVDTILADVELPELQWFRTNLPHSAVAGFLEDARNVKNLFVLVLGGDCGHEGRCALHQVDLASMRNVECSVGCFRHFRSPSITRLALHNKTPAVLTSVALQQTIPYANITHFTLQFYSDDYNVLDKVAAFAPNLRKLRLTELVTCVVSLYPINRCVYQAERHFTTTTPSQCQRNGRVPARRLWKAAKRMADGLKKLPLLEEFMLDSVNDLVNREGRISRLRQEHELIYGWLTGRSMSRRVANTRIKYHPNLYRISLFYGRHFPDTQVLSVWGKYATRTEWDRMTVESGRMIYSVL